ncbi:hypothetical protein C5E10_13640 [Pseudoclavibacter sp. RFBG4]|nr:hypothetical protein C5E10_13640 [Pseudoclavibacter sp. RFBG4]
MLTAAGVTAGMDLAIRLVVRFRGDEYAHFLELGAECGLEPPFGVAALGKAPPEVVALLRAFLAPLKEELRAPAGFTRAAAASASRD